MNQKMLIAMLIGMMSIATHMQAQWIPNGGTNNWFGQLDNTSALPSNWTRSIGIGYFGANFTNSLLHVNSNAPWIAPQNLSIPNAGEVFRTEGPAGVTHAWRMLSNNGTAGDKFFVSNPSGSNSINIGGVKGGAVNFYTNATDPLLPLNMRFRMLGGYNANNGLIGIGDMGTGAIPFDPASQLHQHRNNNNYLYHQFTNGNTGVTTLDGLKIGLTYTAPVTWVDIMQQEDAPLRISTGNNNVAPSQMLERMRFTTGLGGDGVGNWNTIANATKINISSGGIATVPFNFPVACLNIGYDLPGNASGGRRPWMDIGTYYSSNSDHMYTGLLDMGSNRKDAIVNFGDDPQYNAFDNSVQNLRFIFTQWPETPANNGDPYNPTRTQGLEIARMSAQGNMGIGSLFANTLQPARRLEIVDDGITHGAHFGGPQLRLSHVQANAVDISNTGIWTDFQTTDLGDLYIHPSNNATYRRVGINTSTPGNTLEINAVGINGTHTYGVGLSGLRFADMNNTSPSAVAGTYNKFLTVDPLGDVVLSDLPPSISPVTICNVPGLVTNYLTRSTSTNEICKSAAWQANIQDIAIGYFNGGVGYESRLNLDAQDPTQTNDLPNSLYLQNADRNQQSGLHRLIRGDINSAYNNVWGLDINVVNTATSNAEARGGHFTATSNSGDAFGLSAVATGATNSYGVYAQGTGGTLTSHGVYASAQGGATLTYGVYAKAVGTIENYGVYAYAVGSITKNYGIFAKGGTNCSNSSCPDAAGFFDGSVCTTDHYFNTSDSILKKNINNFQNGLAYIKALKTKEFEFAQASFPSMNLPAGKHVGLIAQDVEKLLPELVKNFVEPAEYDSLGKIKTNPVEFKAVNYIALIPYLIAGMQEQQAQIANLQNQINSCCPNNSKSTNQGHIITTTLTDIATIILDQNEPNPFAEETNINYFIPESAGKAELMFYTNDGRLINKVEIKEKGQGTLHIYASDLSSGFYTYTLIVSGKVVETKKMMKEK
jgi:hypothetical protein